MSYKTRRILFFVTTIFVFENISQAKYLLVEIDGEPKIDGRSFDSGASLPGLLPANLTTDAASETADLKLTDILKAGPLQESDLTGTYCYSALIRSPNIGITKILNRNDRNVYLHF